MDQGRGQRETEVPENLNLPPEARDRLRLMKKIDDSKLAEGISNSLGVYLRNLLLQLKVREPNRKLSTEDVQSFLEEARRKGPPEIAAEADTLLSSQSWPKVGYQADSAYLTPIEWQDGVGSGHLKYGTR